MGSKPTERASIDWFLNPQEKEKSPLKSFFKIREKHPGFTGKKGRHIQIGWK